MNKEELKKMSEKELAEQLNYLKKRLLTLEWDKNQNQLNIGMEPMLENTKKEFEEIQQHLNETKKTENVVKQENLAENTETKTETSEETEPKTEETPEEAAETTKEITEKITKETP